MPSYLYRGGASWSEVSSTDLPASGVTAGTYGDATHVGAVTINAEGIVTAASNVAITGGGGGGVGYLGSAVITSSFTTVSGVPVQVTGLTATVTVPAGVRVKITVSAQDIQNFSPGCYTVLTVWDGTVGSGTQIGGTVALSTAGGQQFPVALVVLVNPGVGTKTYSVGLNQVAGGTAELEAQATFPGLLLIEGI
jgi:hypothetical protein